MSNEDQIIWGYYGKVLNPKTLNRQSAVNERNI
jgi:hypothetical protein